MALSQVAAGTRAVISQINAYYELLKGVTGETITLIHNAAASVVIQPSSDPAASTDAIQVKSNAGTVLGAITYDGKFEAADGAVGAPGITFDDDTDTGLYRSGANTLDAAAGGTRIATFDTNGLTLQSKALLQAKGADVASAAALDLGTDGNYFDVTGTTTITSIESRQAGSIVILQFDGILTLTHNATSLILQGATNMTTAAGDVVALVSEGSGNWRELSRRTATAAATFTTNGKLISRYIHNATNSVTAASGYTDFGGSFTTAVTTLTGDQVCIRVQGNLRKDTGGNAGIVIDRGGTKLPGTPPTSVQQAATDTSNPYCLEYWDAPAAGTYTYKPQVWSDDANTARGGLGFPVQFVVEVWR